MRLYTVILIFFLSHGISNSLCQIDKRLSDDDSSRKELKTGLVSLLDTLSIYGTAFSFSHSENALETCCQDVRTPGLDLLFVLGRYFHGVMKWLTVSLIDRFSEGYASIFAKNFRSQQTNGESLTHHGTYTPPPPHPSFEKPVSAKMIKEFSNFANLEATPRRVICKCGKQRGCEQKPPKPFDDSKPIIKALAKTLPKELPSPLLWVILGILAGFIVTVICQITQRAVNNVIQKETAKDTARYIFLALKELDLYTAPTSRQRLRQKSLQQRARKALASRHVRPRPSHTLMDCNNLLETRNPEGLCVQSGLDESTVHAEGKIKDTPDLSLDNTEEDKKMEAEKTDNQRNAENFCDPRMRRADATAKQVSGIEERLDSSPSLWTSQQVPVVDPVWPSGSPWIDSDDYSNAHSIHKLALPSESKASLCSSLGDEMKGPWVSTSLSFIVYDLDIIEDIPDEVLEVLSCDDRPCTVHPHERYHYLGRKVIVQRLPLPDNTTSTTFIPSVDLKVSPPPSVPVQEPVTFLELEHQDGNLETLTSKKLMSDGSPSHLLSIDEIVFNTEAIHDSDQDLDEADNLLVTSKAFTSLNEFENELNTQNVNLDNSESSFFTLFDNDAMSSRFQEGSKTAREFLTKFENVGSMVTALKEVINFCKGITEQQKTEESFAQKEVPLDDHRSQGNDRNIHQRPLISIPLKSLDRSFSLEKVSAVKAGLDELSPGIEDSTIVVTKKKSHSFQEKPEVIEPTSNVFLGRTKPKICIPAAKAASADFIGDQRKPVIPSSAKTSLVTDDSSQRVGSKSKPPDRNALFKDLKETVAARGLGRSENEVQGSLKNAGTDAPEWEDSDLSLFAERSQNLPSNESDSSTLCDFKSSFEKATKWKLPLPPSSSRLSSARPKKDTSGQSPLRKTEKTSDRNDEKDHNIVIVPFGFPVKQNTPEPPSSRAMSSMESTKDSEERLQRSQESFHSDPYRTFSKVSLTEASSTWEVSDRGRNSVFNPVGWSTKRSEVSSLFREQSSEKINEISSQSQAMTLSPRKHTNGESPKIADTRMNSSPVIKSVVENSTMDEHRTTFHTVSDSNPRKGRTSKLNAGSFTSNKEKLTKGSIGLTHSLTKQREKHQSEAMEIPVIYKGTTTGDKSPKAHAVGVVREDPTDSLHQPYIINTETPDRCEKNFRSNWKLSSSKDRPKALITGKPPLPRDNRTSSLYGSRHALQNSVLTKVTSKKSTPVSPRTMSEEESDRDDVSGKDINEELKRRIRGMVKTGKIIQGLIRKKSTGDLSDTSSQQKEESNAPLPKPRASITVYLEGKKRCGPTSASTPQDKVNGRSNVDNSFSATKTRYDKAHDTTTVYQDLYPMGNQDRSDSSQASSGYASVLDREGPVIDILMPVSASSLCSAGMEKFLKPEAIAVSPADGCDAGDSLSQTNVARPKLSKIPIFSNLHEDNRMQRKAKRKSYEAKEDNKNSENIEKESPSVGLGTHIFKSGSEQRPGNSEYTCSVKTGLLGQTRRNANSVTSESTRWVDSKPQESKDTRRKLPVVGDKKALLTSPKKIPRASGMKRVSPLIAQKIGLLERTLTENASGERKEIGKLYECHDSGNSTTNAWAGDVTYLSDKEVTNLRRLDKTRRTGERIRPTATKRVSCLPRLIKHVTPLPREENFSQNHISSVSSNLTMRSPQDQLLCGSFDRFSGELVDSCTDSLQDSIAESVESTRTKGRPQSYVEYLPECEERSHMIVDVINGIDSLKDRMSSSITNYETAELKTKSRILASTLKELQQRLIQRVKNIISKDTKKTGGCERTVRRSKSDSNLDLSFPVSSLAQMNKHRKGLFKEKDSFSSEETKGCHLPTVSSSLPLEGNAFGDLLTVNERFLSQDCSLPDNADSPEMVTIVGFPQANSTVDEDDEDTVTLHGSNCILNADFEDVRMSVTTKEGYRLNLSRRHTAHPTGSFDTSDQDGQAEGAHQVVRCLHRSSSLDELMWNVDLPIAGSRDVMAVLPKMARDLVLWSKNRSHDNEQLTTTALEESFDDLPLHDVIHESRDLRIYGHSSFLELGMAWLLQKTFSKISAKGDNFGIMNISTFDTRIKAIGRNASF